MDAKLIFMDAEGVEIPQPDNLVMGKHFAVSSVDNHVTIHVIAEGTEPGVVALYESTFFPQRMLEDLIDALLRKQALV